MYVFGCRGDVGATLIRDRRRLNGSYVDEPLHYPPLSQEDCPQSSQSGSPCPSCPSILLCFIVFLQGLQIYVLVIRLQPLRQLYRWSGIVGSLIMERLDLIGGANKAVCIILGVVQVVTYPVNLILQPSVVDSTSKDLINLVLRLAINQDWLLQLPILTQQRVLQVLLQLISVEDI